MCCSSCDCDYVAVLETEVGFLKHTHFIIFTRFCPQFEEAIENVYNISHEQNIDLNKGP